MKENTSKITKYRFSIDRGGTFTDVYAELPEGQGFETVKLLSEDPANYPDAPREGIRRIVEKTTGRQLLKESFSAEMIEWIRMGTTVATNALLERTGKDTVLMITRGFSDLLEIGDQTRPEIFDLQIRKPDLLYRQVIEVDERVRLKRADDESDDVAVGTTGEEFLVLKKPDPSALRRQLQEAYDKGFRSAAIVFMHAYAFPDHERMAGYIARQVGFSQVSLSHEVMPRVKMVARGDTTLLDAYLTPHINGYLESFKAGFACGLKDTRLLFMQSDGGLVPAEAFKGSNAILSGPAGGVVGYAMTTFSKTEKKPVIGFDMGGTSTDVSRYAGEFERVHETMTAGVRIQAPQLHIRTVAAGGGSRLFFRNNMFAVGPESAGAHPGPVCYRKNGYLSVTDANLFLGRLQPDYFPKIFGPAQDLPLDHVAVKKAFEDITETVNLSYEKQGTPPLSPEAVALGFFRVANETMIRAIREISVMRGYDIKEHVLACFGGAGGQHACAIARELGISKIFIHRFSGILSAYGMGMADVVAERQEPAAVILEDTHLAELNRRLGQLAASARAELESQGFGAGDIRTARYLHLRYEGTDTPMMIREHPGKGFSETFRTAHIREFGFDLRNRKIMVDDIRVRAVARIGRIRNIAVKEQSTPPLPDSVKPCYFENGWQDTEIYRMANLGAGHEINGPAMIMQDGSTILIEPGCRAKITKYGDVVIDVATEVRRNFSDAVNPVRLSIFSHLFMSVAEQMGRTLEKTAISTNIKERRDFSCAVFDKQGNLVANAPHLPVHLGAMGEAVRNQIRLRKHDLQPGDVLVTNHPAVGGSHLPDITVITPVWQGMEPIFYVASRGHHADIGGISPGSMPPFSRALEEEGACITSFKLVENNVFKEMEISRLLLAPGKIKRGPGQAAISGTRRLSDTISDLKAQVAANQKGMDLMTEMIAHYSLDVVVAYMTHIRENAASSVRSMLGRISTMQGLAAIERISAQDFLDDGTPIRLALTINRANGTAVFDFSGTGKELSGNLNTSRAVTYSAILYVLRCLVNQDIPLNQGCLAPIRVIIEPGSLLDPSENAAVVGGNVLTSQRITDVILKAFKAAAASQGCMNNLTFGNEHFGYYETIGGGAGAGPAWHGRSGVHTHMTNTRITDPEILERRYPVMLKRFCIRKGSGGKGKYNGGDGLIREIEFLDDLNVAILSERRVFAPYGLEGGEPGNRGANIFRFADGRHLDLGGKNEISAGKGDRILILTPGGGGYGKKQQA